MNFTPGPQQRPGGVIQRMARAAATGSLAVLASCGTPSANSTPPPASTTQTVATNASSSVQTSATSGVPDLAVASPNQLYPGIAGGVAYRVSLMRPLVLVTVPGEGWAAAQFNEKPDMRAEFVLHDELQDNADGVVAFGGGDSLQRAPDEWIKEIHGLAGQAAGPIMTGTIGDGVPTIEYEADVVGGQFRNTIEVPPGWRMHIMVLTAHDKNLSITYSAPAAKFAAFTPIARMVLASLRFP